MTKSEHQTHRSILTKLLPKMRPLPIDWRTIALPVAIEPEHLAAIRQANEQRQLAALKRWTPTVSLKKAK